MLDCLRTHGALFFAELPDASGLLAPQVEDALSELVAWGLVTSDNFGGLRALLVPSDRRKPSGGGSRRRRILSFGMEDAGRWALGRHPAEAAGAAALKHVAHALLRRYGVVFWRLLAREPDWLPPWRDLVRVYRRLEARGEIPGGRFVAGFAGEQYALPDALGMLRQVRRRPHADEFVSLSGADPLNLAGILTGNPENVGSRFLSLLQSAPTRTFSAISETARKANCRRHSCERLGGSMCASQAVLRDLRQGIHNQRIRCAPRCSVENWDREGGKRDFEETRSPPGCISCTTGARQHAN